MQEISDKKLSSLIEIIKESIPCMICRRRSTSWEAKNVMKAEATGCKRVLPNILDDVAVFRGGPNRRTT